MTSGFNHPLIRPKRLGVFGGSVLEKENVEFCLAIGRAISREEGLILVTGGFKYEIKYPGTCSVDWSVVKGCLEGLDNIGISTPTRIETLIPDPKIDPRDLKKYARFKEGQTHFLNNRSKKSRRFILVNSTDVLLSVDGSKGARSRATREMIDLALALEKPCLPLPFTGGASLQRWKENRIHIQKCFDMEDEIADKLENVELRYMDRTEIADLAETVKELLIRKLKRKIFVIMPFKGEYNSLYDETIKKAIITQEFIPVRADRLNLVGNAIEVLRSAINSCDAAIALITDRNPNVMYELGLAHALGKPVIIMNELDHKSDLPELPFDLKNEYVVGYDDDLEKTRESLEGILEQLQVFS